ncbi:NAD(+) diphosphatase [Victivallis sp. Marseille-Q1083]|uniref:NAD(+) diphosphatase n=1 Tax=Victivallis sp. Marseille-Q1083 TaxID=2717288 RepID=UPI001588A8B5|nr:NAD(+) diphosphatase [Victivallis sp. Marseille-Q1083]
MSAAGFIPAPAPHPTTLQQCRPEAAVIVFRDREILLTATDGAWGFPTAAELELPGATPLLNVGQFDCRSCLALELPAWPALPPQLQVCEIRQVLAQFPDDAQFAASRAKHLLYWRKQHRFCGGCGAPTVGCAEDVALVCPQCGSRFYPQLAPAIIVAVTRGDQLLLAHNRKFKTGLYGLIAGFVEAGENLEQAVRRELAEETGITVDHIAYFGSQTWPFPNALMLGFTARYAGGDARPDGSELTELGWFSADALPTIPAPGSIARRLIDHFRLLHATLR